MKETEKASSFPVYTQKLAGHLMMLGYVLIDLAPNERDTRKNVFYFKDSTQIKEAIQTYLNKSRA